MVGAWGLTVRDTHRVALAALLAAVASRPSSHPVALTPWLSPFFVGLPRWVFVFWFFCCCCFLVFLLLCFLSALSVNCGRYGLLSTAYFAEGLRLIRDRVALAEPGSATQLVAIVFTTQESVEWCKKILVKALQQTAEKVVCADTSGSVKRNAALTPQNATATTHFPTPPAQYGLGASCLWRTGRCAGSTPRRSCTEAVSDLSLSGGIGI